MFTSHDCNASSVQVYCKGAVGAVFVYDVQNEYSLLNLGQWRHTLNSLVTQKDKKPIPAVVIGNKVSGILHILDKKKMILC